MALLKSHLADTDFSVRMACTAALKQLGAAENARNYALTLARLLDTNNPSPTDWYNYRLFCLISSNGGPNMRYNFVARGEGTETQILENKKALKAMLGWANSSNTVPER